MYCHVPSSFSVLGLLLEAFVISQRCSSLSNTSAPFSITHHPSFFTHHHQLRASIHHQAPYFIISHHRALSCICVRHHSLLSVIIGHLSLWFIVTHHQPLSGFNIHHVSVSVVIRPHRSTWFIVTCRHSSSSSIAIHRYATSWHNVNHRSLSPRISVHHHTSSFHQHQSPSVVTNQRRYYLCSGIILFFSIISGICHRS